MVVAYYDKSTWVKVENIYYKGFQKYVTFIQLTNLTFSELLFQEYVNQISMYTFCCYRYFSLKTTISAQQIFQSLVRNKQFKFSRVFWVQLAQLSLFWFQKCAKIWTAYFWPKLGRSAARKQFFWAWSGCTHTGSASTSILKKPFYTYKSGLYLLFL